MRSILRSALALFVAVVVLTGGLPSGIRAQAQEAEATPAPSTSPAAEPTPTPPPPAQTPAPASSPSETKEPAATSSPATSEPAPAPSTGDSAGGESAASEGSAETGPSAEDRADGVLEATPEICDILEAIGVKCMRAVGAPPDVVEILSEVIATVGNCPPVCPGDLVEQVQRLLNQLIQIDCDSSCIPQVDARKVYEAIDRVGELVADVCPGLDCVPNPDPWVDAVTGIVADVCPGLDCVPEIDANEYVERVSDLVTGVCEGSVTTGTASAGTSAAEPGGCVDLVLGVAETVVRVVCGYNGTTECANDLIDSVTTILANTCSSSTSRAADPSGDCVELVMSVVALVLETACGSSNATACTNELIDRVATALENACNSSTRADPSGACVEVVMSAVDLVLRTACSSTNATTCVNNLVARAGTIIENACRSGTVTSASTAADPSGACADKVDQVVDLVLNTACDTTNATTCVNNLVDRVATILESTCEGSVTRAFAAGTTAADPSGACVELAESVVDLVFQTVCQSGANTTCVNNLVTRVNNLLVGVCTGSINTSATFTGAGTAAGAHPCADMVTDVVNLVLATVCQSTDATTCANNLITRVNTLLAGVCSGSINTSATRAGELDHACVEKVGDLVDTVLLTVCQSRDGVTCANNLITRINNLLIGACTGSINTSTGTRAGEHPCVDKLTDVVDTILITVCQSRDGVTCANNLITKVNNLVVGLCTGSINTSTGTRAGEHPCVDKLTDVVDSILVTVCQSADEVTCANNLITRVNNLLVGACTGSINTSTGTRAAAHPCVEKVGDVVDIVLTTACQSTDAATCANNLITRVNNLLTGVCTGQISTTALSTGSTTAAGEVSHPCVEEVSEVVRVVLTTACQSDAAGPCASYLINRVDDVLRSACSGGVTTSALGTRAAPPSQDCVEKVAGVVATVLLAACESGNAATCADNLLDEVDALLADACTGGTVTTGATTMMAAPEHDCIDTFTVLVDTIVKTVCASADAGICAEDLVQQVRTLLATACGSTTGLGTEDAETCAQALADMILGAVPGVCVSSDALSAVVNCAGPVAVVIADLLEQSASQSGLSVLSFSVHPRRIYPGSSSRNRITVNAHVTGGAWRAEVRDSSGNPVRSFAGLAGATTVEWDGRDELGVIVPNGAYEIVLLGPTDDAETAGTLESAWVFVGDGPKIGAVVPASASIGDRVTLVGSGFTPGVGVFGVTIGDNDADVVSWSDNQVVVRIPATVDPGTYDMTLSVADAEATRQLTIRNYIPAPAGDEHVAPGVIYVEVKPGAAIATIAATLGDTVRGPALPVTGPETQHYYEVNVPPGLENLRIQAYASRSDVNFAEPMFNREPTATPNDTYYPNQWYLKTQPDDADVDAPQGWNLSKSNGTVSIGILDTEIGAHPDLNLLPGRAYTNGCPDGMDGAFHGTYVAGIAAATTNNNRGVAGMGWNARPRGYRLGYEQYIKKTGKTECWVSGQWTDAIAHAAGTDDVVNLSFGGVGGDTRLEQKAVNEAWAKGLVIVASAGNDETSDKAYPAAYDHVVSVGALNRNNGIADFSNRGGWVDVWAPGVGFTSTYKAADGSFSYTTGGWGTSFSAPLVAGAFALMIGQAPSFPNAELVHALKSTTQGSPPRISTDAALRKLVDPKLPSGLFARRRDSSAVYFIDGGVRRRVTARVLNSWGISSTRGSQVAVVQAEQLQRFDPRTPKLGFRPGTLIRLDGGTDVFVVTNDGGWRQGQKRLLPPEFMTCLGYNVTRVVDVSQGELNIHPNGQPVAGCDQHPNGTLVRTVDPISGAETYDVLQAGTRRNVRTTQLGASYGYLEDAVAPAPGDLTLPPGAAIGFRPGRLIRFDGKIWIITTGGSDFATGVRREFANSTVLSCYGLSKAPRLQAQQNEATLHTNGDRLDC